jgi:endonuclease G
MKRVVWLLGVLFVAVGLVVRPAGLAVADPGPAPVASPHLALGTPIDADPSDDYRITRAQYAISYNPRRLTPNWAAWRLRSEDMGATTRHKGRFMPDDALPSGWYRVRHDDYSGSGLDRGHLVRSADRTASAADNAATFYMTNVVPQSHALNYGAWLRLEEYCAALARQGRALYIVAGPLYGAAPRTIGHGVAVPSALWKVVVVLETGQTARDVSAATRVIAAIMPNIETPHHAWGRYRVSVDEVERRSGYELLGDVEVAVQSVIEARVDGGATR